jgi:hypothetical protein
MAKATRVHSTPPTNTSAVSATGALAPFNYLRREAIRVDAFEVRLAGAMRRGTRS